MNRKTSPLAGGWLVVFLLWFVAALNYVDRIAITTMRGSLVEAIPMTDAQFGMLTGVFLLVYGFFSPFAGFLADRFSRSWVIISSMLTWSLVTWLTGQATTYNELFVARALMGFSEACYLPAALSLISDYHRGTTRSLATGIHMTGLAAGSICGGIGGWLAETYHWTLAFNLFGLIGIVYSIVLMLILRDAPSETSDLLPQDNSHAIDANLSQEPLPPLGFFAALHSLLKLPAFRLILVYWGLLGCAGWVLITWLPTYLVEYFGLSQSKAGPAATSLLFGSLFLGMIVGGILADNWSRTNARGRILIPAIGLFIAGPSLFLASTTTVLMIYFIGIAIHGFSRAFCDSNMMPILYQVVDPRCRATGYGVLNLCSCAVGGIWVYVGGALRDANVPLSSIFQFSALLFLVCGVLILLVPVNEQVKP